MLNEEALFSMSWQIFSIKEVNDWVGPLFVSSSSLLDTLVFVSEGGLSDIFILFLLDVDVVVIEVV